MPTPIDHGELAGRLRTAVKRSERPASHPKGPYPVQVLLDTQELGLLEAMLLDAEAAALDRMSSRLSACDECGERPMRCRCPLPDPNVRLSFTLRNFFDVPRIGYSTLRVQRLRNGIEVRLRPSAKRDAREMLRTFRIGAWWATDLLVQR